LTARPIGPSFSVAKLLAVLAPPFCIAQKAVDIRALIVNPPM
jgi:hypothetical protein